ncbi:MAG: pyrroline-5-carboxylate reductase [Candidatus Hinthialibacter sp.]
MDKKIAFIGGGNMAAAVLSGLLRKQVAGADEILVTEKLPERRAYLEATHHVETTEDNAQAPKRSRTVFLAVKPQMLAQVQDDLRPGLTEDHVVISILAGITRERLGKALGRMERIVRVMPNLPAQVGRGVSAISFPQTLGEEDREWVRTIMRSAGEVVEVEEPLQDAVTAVSGSGPGYLFYFVDLFVQAGVKQGLPRDVALRLATETLAGTAEVLRQTSDSPEELVRKVATPGGTTEAGLSALKEHGLGDVLDEMVERATRRSKELNQG